MTDTVEDVQARWPYTNKPLWNSEALVELSAALRSQVLTHDLFYLTADLMDDLRAAQDDITTAIALVEKRLGVKE